MVLGALLFAEMPIHVLISVWVLLPATVVCVAIGSYDVSVVTHDLGLRGSLRVMHFWRRSDGKGQLALQLYTLRRAERALLLDEVRRRLDARER